MISGCLSLCSFMCKEDRWLQSSVIPPNIFLSLNLDRVLPLGCLLLCLVRYVVCLGEMHLYSEIDLPCISVSVGCTGVTARALETPIDLNVSEQPRLGPPPTPLPRGPGAPLKLRPGPCHSQPCSLLSQVLGLFFLDGAWRHIAGSLPPAPSPGWAPMRVLALSSVPVWAPAVPTGSLHGSQPWLFISICCGLWAEAVGVTYTGAPQGRASPLPELPFLPWSGHPPSPCCFLSGFIFPFSSVWKLWMQTKHYSVSH